MVSADQLDYQDDVAILTTACFVLEDWQFDTPELRIEGETARASDVRIGTQGVRGTAALLEQQGQSVRFENVRVSLELPSTQLGELPLGEGVYTLTASSGSLTRTDAAGGNGPALRFAAARLEKVGASPPESYALEDATLSTYTLRARRAQLSRNRINLDASNVANHGPALQAGRNTVSICRDPQGKELVLDSRALRADRDRVEFRDGRLQAFGVTVAHLQSFHLPLAATGVVLPQREATPVSTLRDVGDRLGSLGDTLVNNPPYLVVGGDDQPFGIRNIPLFDPYQTRLSVVLHQLGSEPYLELNTRSNLGFALLDLGIFPYEDPTLPPRPQPLPMVVLSRDPDAGLTFRYALRSNVNDLSELRIGGALRLSPQWRLQTDIGGAQQAREADAFMQAKLSGGDAFRVDAINLTGSWNLEGQVYLFAMGGPYGVLRAALNARVDQPAYLLEGRYAQVSDTAPPSLGAYRPSRLNDLVLTAALKSPEPGSPFGVAPILPAYSYQRLYRPDKPEDSSIGRLTAGVALGGSGRRELEFGKTSVLYTLEQDWFHSGAISGQELALGTRITRWDERLENPRWALSPTVGYDWVKSKFRADADLTLYSNCFGFTARMGVTLERDAAPAYRFGLALELR